MVRAAPGPQATLPRCARLPRFIKTIDGFADVLKDMGVPALIATALSYMSSGGINAYFKVVDGKIQFEVDAMTYGQNIEIPFCPLDGSAPLVMKNPIGIEVSVTMKMESEHKLTFVEDPTGEDKSKTMTHSLEITPGTPMTCVHTITTKNGVSMTRFLEKQA